MVGAFTAILTVLAYQNDLINIQSDITEQNIKRNQESFSINSYVTGSGPSYGLHTDVTNLGTNDVEIVDLWHSDKSSPYVTTSISIDFIDSFVPPGGTTKVLDSQSISITAGTYTIKVVSALGTMVTKEIQVPPLILLDIEDILVEKLVAKPAVYVAFPSPF